MKLIKASLEYKSQITEMIKEWKEDIDRNKTNEKVSFFFYAKNTDQYLNNKSIAR